MVVGVEQEQEAVVVERLAAYLWVGEAVAVEYDGERFGSRRELLVGAHLVAVGAEPADVGDVAAEDRTSFDGARGVRQLMATPHAGP